MGIFFTILNKLILKVIYQMKYLYFWQLIGFVFTVFLGVVLHFAFEWSNEALILAPFSAVNESVWEHMKILFFPMLIYSFFQGFFFEKYPNYWSIKLKVILVGIILIPGLYYLYNGAIGNSPDWLNILIFVISAAIAYIYENKLFRENKKSRINKKESIILIVTIMILFILFTFAPIELNIFKDPTTNTYGL